MNQFPSRPNRDSQSASSPSAQSNFRGLPAPDALRDLARTYLTEQHAHWPELAGTAAVPAITDESITKLAAEYETAYRDQQVTAFSRHLVDGKCDSIGAAYIRYSDKNSNARSLDQQLINVLRIAKREGTFIPWTYVFGDAAITGTTTERNGYQMLRQLVQADARCERIFADDLDRLNRDQIESLTLSKLLEAYGKRLTTANGYDSVDQSAKLTHSFKAMQNEFFIDQLREKVDRGMTDAFKRGKNVGLPPLGYKRVARLDAAGQPIINRKGKCETDVVIDDEAADIVRRIFTMYAELRMSPRQIAHRFNDEQVLDKNSWTHGTIAQHLRNQHYTGRMTFRTTKTIIHPTTGKKTSIPRPESEHLVQDIPELRIISDELWAAVCKRRREVSRNTHPADKPAKSRQACYPTRLFDLYCRDCDRPLQLNRSGKYSQICCPNGKERLRGCTLIQSKTLTIVEECILNYLRQRLLGDEAMEQLLAKANQYLAEEAAKPPVDTAALDRKIRSATDKIKRMASRLADLGDGVAARTLVANIEAAEEKLHGLNAERELAAQANVRPQPMPMSSFKELLKNLRQLLADDVVAAHAVLAKAVGKAYATIGPKRGRSNAWFVEINVNPVPVLLEIAQRTNCPTAYTLEFLLARSWTISATAMVETRPNASFERIASQAAELKRNGASANAIAIALRCDSRTVAEALRWAATFADGRAPQIDLPHTRKQQVGKVDEIAANVARMRDEDGKSFHAIGRELGVHEALVSRAYRHFYRDAHLAALGRGEKLDSGVRRKLSPEKVAEIRRLIIEGKLSDRAIARHVGCTPWVIRRDRKRSDAERADDAA